MSRDLESWLVNDVGLPRERITQLYNGVDLSRFASCDVDVSGTPLQAWRDAGSTVFGTVGRMEAIKDPMNLARAFAAMTTAMPQPLRSRVRLVMVGGGALESEVRQFLDSAGLMPQCWLPGPRNDVPRLLPALDVFVLPSLGEGISNTILEAMACARPVVATAVGGNPELVTQDTGTLVPAGDPALLAHAMTGYAIDSQLRRRHGEAGRARAMAEFSLEAMVRRYQDLYEDLLRTRS
jgi:glycosyltransferase involved in cell wall biosynthesis